MQRVLHLLLLSAFFLGMTGRSSAFSLLGPAEDWQTAELGYNPFGTDIGAPMNLGEEYRWNIRTITYAFDPSFINYFGPKGVAEVQKAVAIINKLPPMNKMSRNLNEFPLDTFRLNLRASSLGLIDLKSVALATLVEELGLTSPERYTWTIRNRTPIDGGGFWYVVVMRNFDPVTYQPTPYVNGKLLTYYIGDPVLPAPETAYADAVEVPVDPLVFRTTSVAAINGGISVGLPSFATGAFLTGLTRDDAGGLRYIYRPNNYNVEGLLPNSTVLTSGGRPWTPVGGASNVVDVALRPGINKITLRQVAFDSVFGQWVPFTNRYTDTYVTNSVTLKQGIGRLLTAPDIVFSAADLGVDDDGDPFTYLRTDTANWINNAGTNTIGGGDGVITGGPGVIVPPVHLVFSKMGPHNLNQYSGNSFLLDEEDASMGFVWGSFDGTTNAPFIYPSDPNGRGFPIETLESLILNRPIRP